MQLERPCYYFLCRLEANYLVINYPAPHRALILSFPYEPQRSKKYGALPPGRNSIWRDMLLPPSVGMREVG